MKKSKLLLSLLTISLSATLLVACGAEKTKTEESSTTATTETEVAVSSEPEEKIDLNSLDLPQLKSEVGEDEYLVEMVTSMGNIEIRLFPAIAPKTVENFVTHAKEGYYNDLYFHRIIKDFMIQGGDPKGDGTGGESIWEKPFEDELSNQLYNIRGALSMANSGPDTNGSQFFIVQNSDDVSDGLLTDEYPDAIIEKYKEGGAPHLDYASKGTPSNHAVFGQVSKGMDVVDKIADVKTEGDTPNKTVSIKEIKILQEPKK